MTCENTKTHAITSPAHTKPRPMDARALDGRKHAHVCLLLPAGETPRCDHRPWGWKDLPARMLALV